MKTKTTPKAETESRTRIQAYSKSQLAGLYLPHIQSASARRTLRSWIAKNTALQAALAQTGYSEKAILLTPAQVRLFFKFLGEPCYKESKIICNELSAHYIKKGLYHSGVPPPDGFIKSAVTSALKRTPS